MLVGRLDGLDGGLELIGVFHRLREDVDARVDRQHLPAFARIQIGNGLQSLLFGAGQMVAIAHAEGIVDGDNQHFAPAGARRGSRDERIGEGEREQKQQQQHAAIAAEDSAAGGV